ncbi:uncharacterized protein LACBIDRAFT_298338 [Laccaria bicolor S238N-H82]|uniref:Predicted protein n=1 Tax=Laccaria bicolor (strain S238N-H82 / ATCC MYA-4686) TaxID=486041 RepID=B0E3A8_LACBS|nr:uncharacterized protein LACBIDRAFT_298338 [Laccaria bicolor S238N-H82]EDQ98663.1 predicted protein [Laccaria bicolor S238N-H82]|eukprot:XP_001890676.1 predicted protein [Laccaria bicolor S238N-H82]
MNLSHVIASSQSPNPYTHTGFVAYQYFLHVVPRTYIAPRSVPLQTHQYGLTHYIRIMQ